MEYKMYESMAVLSYNYDCYLKNCRENGEPEKSFFGYIVSLFKNN